MVPRLASVSPLTNCFPTCFLHHLHSFHGEHVLLLCQPSPQPTFHAFPSHSEEELFFTRACRAPCDGDLHSDHTAVSLLATQNTLNIFCFGGSEYAISSARWVVPWWSHDFLTYFLQAFAELTW